MQSERQFAGPQEVDARRRGIRDGRGRLACELPEILTGLRWFRSGCWKKLEELFQGRRRFATFPVDGRHRHGLMPVLNWAGFVSVYGEGLHGGRELFGPAAD